ncbi:hypothetical protein [Streptomyces sp. NPDC048361]|uniref:hypothetical protein n=1 Tax=Streptomyces sp. NPDC048361 TaxID=3154720 RepID=UPI0034491238
MTHAEQPIPERSTPERPVSERPTPERSTSGRPLAQNSASGRAPVEQTDPEQGVTERPVSQPSLGDRRTAGAPDTAGTTAPERAVPEGSAAEPPLAGHALGGSGATDATLAGRATPDEGVRERSARGQTVSGPDAAGAQGVRGADALPGDGTRDETVLRPDERDKLQLRLQRAVGGFVDEPRAAVEEAATAVDELTEHLIETLGHRRGALRASWQDTSGGAATEDLRMALREYRQLAERLLSL